MEAVKSGLLSSIHFCFLVTEHTKSRLTACLPAAKWAEFMHILYSWSDYFSWWAETALRPLGHFSMLLRLQKRHSWQAIHWRFCLLLCQEQVPGAVPTSARTVYRQMNGKESSKDPLWTVHQRQTNKIRFKYRVLVDPTSCTIDFNIYYGATEGTAEKGLAYKVVMDFIQPFRFQGYRLYCDTFKVHIACRPGVWWHLCNWYSKSWPERGY